MGNVERCDKTLPVNEMMFHVRRDAMLRARFVEDLQARARVRAEPSRVRSGSRQGSAPDDGPRRAPILRAADPPAVFRRRAQQQRQRRARMLPAGVPGGDGEGDGPAGTARASAVKAQVVAAMAMTHSPGLTG